MTGSADPLDLLELRRMNSSLATTAATAVVGLLLAVGTALGVASAAGSTPEPVDEPTVLYGER